VGFLTLTRLRDLQTTEIAKRAIVQPAGHGPPRSAGIGCADEPLTGDGDPRGLTGAHGAHLRVGTPRLALPEDAHVPDPGPSQVAQAGSSIRDPNVTYSERPVAPCCSRALGAAETAPATKACDQDLPPTEGRQKDGRAQHATARAHQHQTTGK
jgi:hypothetical protein